jgi:hypothetical protein
MVADGPFIDPNDSLRISDTPTVDAADIADVIAEQLDDPSIIIESPSDEIVPPADTNITNGTLQVIAGSTIDLSNPKMYAALELWFSGMSLKKISQKIGVDITTIIRWKKDPAFAEAVQERKSLITHDARSIIMEAAADAATKLAEIARGGDRIACVDILKASQVIEEKNSLQVQQSNGVVQINVNLSSHRQSELEDVIDVEATEL